LRAARCVQSPMFVRVGRFVPVGTEKTPARYVAGADRREPSASEPREPAYPFDTAKSDSNSCSRASVKPSSTRTHSGSAVGSAGRREKASDIFYIRVTLPCLGAGTRDAKGRRGIARSL